MGGLLGSAQSNSGNLLIGNTYKTRNVSSTATRIGGLVGEMLNAANTSTRIFNSYANGSISGAMPPLG